MHPIIAELEREQLDKRRQEFVPPDFRPGDTIAVGVKIIEGERERTQVFEGVCIARRNRGMNENFTVRKVSYGEGVERVFPLQAPMIVFIEVKRRGDVRRAKLYYLRLRRGKGARIPERADVWRFRDSLLNISLPGLRSTFDKMVTALEQLQDLKGAAQGPKVFAAVSRALQDIPASPMLGVGRNDAFELALSMGEHLCPLMFSYDKAVAGEARKGLARLGQLIAKHRPDGSREALLVLLRHLTVEVLIELSIRQERSVAKVQLTVKDLLYAATERPGLKEHQTVRIQLLLEDADDMAIETLAEKRIGPRSVERYDGSVCGDGETLGSKFVTLLADGHEVFRFPLARNAERLFVV